MGIAIAAQGMGRLLVGDDVEMFGRDMATPGKGWRPRLENN
jgi:hypothetical protein